MSNNNHSKESSQLLKKITDLEFVNSAEINSVKNLTRGNFKTTINYHKISKWYVANINFWGHNYKVFIEVKGNKPNPKYEKQLKKIF